MGGAGVAGCVGGKAGAGQSVWVGKLVRARVWGGAPVNTLLPHLNSKVAGKPAVTCCVHSSLHRWRTVAPLRHVTRIATPPLSGIPARPVAYAACRTDGAKQYRLWHCAHGARHRGARRRAWAVPRPQRNSYAGGGEFGLSHGLSATAMQVWGEVLAAPRPQRNSYAGVGEGSGCTAASAQQLARCGGRFGLYRSLSATAMQVGGGIWAVPRPQCNSYAGLGGGSGCAAASAQQLCRCGGRFGLYSGLSATAMQVGGRFGLYRGLGRPPCRCEVESGAGSAGLGGTLDAEV
eukprot:366505-Chlamydomonas_euryale.AAC.5